MVEQTYKKTPPELWDDGHSHIGDDGIRAVMEGLFFAFKCATWADAQILNRLAFLAGTFSVHYRDVYVVMSMGQEETSDFWDFLKRAEGEMSAQPAIVTLSPNVPNQLVECLQDCWHDAERAREGSVHYDATKQV